MQPEPVYQVAPNIFLTTAQVQKTHYEWASMLAQPRPALGIFPVRKDYYDSSSIDELNYILILYLNNQQNPGAYAREGSTDRIFVGSTQFWGDLLMLTIPGQIPVFVDSFAGRANLEAAVLNFATESGPSKKDGKILRPLNAFILFRKELHDIYVAENPGVCNTEISALIGKKWRSMDIEEKVYYYAKADRLKQDHVKKYPSYKYQPRKSSEVKRRMTKKKAATLEAELIVSPSTLSFVAASQYRPNTISSLPGPANTTGQFAVGGNIVGSDFEIGPGYRAAEATDLAALSTVYSQHPSVAESLDQMAAEFNWD